MNYNYKIMKKKFKVVKNNNFKNNKKSIPAKEKIFISINKLKFKIRNFKEFYITKTKRNKYQDILIKN